MSNKQKILIAAIVVALLVVGVVYLFIPKTQITFTVAPNAVQVQIDNGGAATINNGDTVSVSPGNHTIIVSQDEFTRYQTTISVKKGEKQEVLVALVANTVAAQNLLDNPTSQAIVQRFNGNILTNQTDQLDKDYPILKVLPIDSRLYTITACASQKYPDDSTKIAVCVSSDEDQATLQPYVEQDLLNRGYKASDYEMIYNTNTGD